MSSESTHAIHKSSISASVIESPYCESYPNATKKNTVQLVVLRNGQWLLKTGYCKKIFGLYSTKTVVLILQPRYLVYSQNKCDPRSTGMDSMS